MLYQEERKNMVQKYQGHMPEIAPDVFVAETASVVGNVRIGARSSVWFGAVIRGDTCGITIGEGSNVQDNATLHCDKAHPLHVGNNVTIGHNAIVHCSEVGDHTLVGMGSCLMARAVIGKNCVIGAGAVVRSGEVVPDGTMMVGVPARAVKTLSEDAIAERQQESFYVALARNYMEK